MVNLIGNKVRKTLLKENVVVTFRLKVLNISRKTIKSRDSSNLQATQALHFNGHFFASYVSSQHIMKDLRVSIAFRSHHKLVLFTILNIASKIYAFSLRQKLLEGTQINNEKHTPE